MNMLLGERPGIIECQCPILRQPDRACPIFGNAYTTKTSASSHKSVPRAQKPHPVPPEVQRLRSHADNLYRAGQFDEAIALLTQAITCDQSDPESFLLRGRAHARNQHHSAALHDFQTASTKRGYVPTPDVLLQIARSRLLLGSPSSALLAVRDALALDPADGQVLLLRRRILELEGHITAYHGAVSRKHWRMARSAYESCIGVYAQEDSDAPTYIRCWGIELLVIEGSWVAAMKSVDILLKDIPNSVEALALHARVLFLQGEFTKAVTQVMAVLKLDPDNHSAKALRTRLKEVSRLKDAGNESFRKGRWEEAIKSWGGALQLVGEREDEFHGGIIRAVLLLNRATACQKLCNYAEGLKDVDESLKLRPDYHRADLCRARIMIGLELYDTAAEAYRAALEHGKGTMGTIERRGIEKELEDVERRALKERDKEQDHYSVLGLEKGCTSAEIKKAYRTLCLKHHPDKGGVAEKFKMIASAYEVLSDPDQKLAYDAKHRKRNGYSFTRGNDYESDEEEY
ncbi:hypothetical protein C8Q74DRAFT_1316108 [Fomes fomentarius]|nr:hypothetical protein C8Q74DRAFT_1316108 [Fomes fomentarius]